MDFKEFEKEVALAVKRLPVEYRRLLEKEEISVIPREKVPPGLRKRQGKGIIFGVFVGTSRKSRRLRYVYPEPTRIEIYMKSFERAFGKELTDEVRQRINRTVIHEIAHYFGFDEYEVRSRGY